MAMFKQCCFSIITDFTVEDVLLYQSTVHILTCGRLANVSDFIG